MLNCMNTTHHRHFEHYVSESKYISLQDCSKEKKLQPFFGNYKLISASKNRNKRKRKLKMSLLSSFCAKTFKDFYTNTQHHVE